MRAETARNGADPDEEFRHQPPSTVHRLECCLAVRGNTRGCTRSQYHDRAQDSELRRSCGLFDRKAMRAPPSVRLHGSSARGAALRCAHNELSKSWVEPGSFESYLGVD
jgi:hypothetical protein